jgi:hypothetical protein
MTFQIRRRGPRAAARGLIALAMMFGLCFGGPAAAAARQPTLVVALSTEPSQRSALRGVLSGEQAGRLEAWRRQGLLAGYRLLFTRYADTGVWDGLEVLTFRDEAALARWNSIEQASPGGLSPRALALVSQVVSTPADHARGAEASRDGSDSAYLVVPYQSLVSASDYLKYLDGYTLPQFQGWMAEGVLGGYEVEVSRYPADRPWSALILLRYRDDAALARRDETTAKVRARLAQDPSWKAISDGKQNARVEKRAAVADQLAAADAAP